MQSTRLTFLVAVVLLTATCSVSAQVELVLEGFNMPQANAMVESQRRAVRQREFKRASTRKTLIRREDGDVDLA